MALKLMTGGFCMQMLRRREKTLSDPERSLKSVLKEVELDREVTIFDTTI